MEIESKKPMKTRKAISLATKYKMVKDIERGEQSKKTIAAKYGISPSTLSMIFKQQKVIEKMYVANSATSYTNSRKRLRLSFYPDLESSLYDWYLKSPVPVSRGMMIEKAMEIAKTLGYTNFKASYGFIERFKFRKGITFVNNKSFKTAQHNVNNVKHEQDDSVELEIDISNPDQNLQSDSNVKAGKEVCSDHFVDGRPTEVNPVPTLYLGFDRTMEGPCFRKVRKRRIPTLNVEQGDYPTGHVVSDYIPHIASKINQSEKEYGIGYEETTSNSPCFEKHSASGEGWGYKQQYPDAEDTIATTGEDDAVHSDYKDQSIGNYQTDQRRFEECQVTYSDNVSRNEPVRKIKNRQSGKTCVTSNPYFRQQDSSEISEKRKKTVSLQNQRSGSMQQKQFAASTISIIPPEEIKVEQGEDWGEDNSYERQIHFVEQSQHSLSTEHQDRVSFAGNTEHDVGKVHNSNSGTVVINLQDVNMSTLTYEHRSSPRINEKQRYKTDTKILDSPKYGLKEHSDHPFSGAVPVSLSRVSTAIPNENLGTISDVNEGSFTVSSKCSCCDQMVEIKVTEFKKLLKLFIKPEFLDEICAC